MVLISLANSAKTVPAPILLRLAAEQIAQVLQLSILIAAQSMADGAHGVLGAPALCLAAAAHRQEPELAPTLPLLAAAQAAQGQQPNPSPVIRRFVLPVPRPILLPLLLIAPA